MSNAVASAPTTPYPQDQASGATTQNQIAQTAPTIGRFDPNQLTLITDEADPKYGFLADKRAKGPVDDLLVQSMQEEGFTSLLQAIKAEDGRIIMVTGRRRVLAARVANVKPIVQVYPATGQTDLQLFARKIRENTIRLEDDPFALAESAQKFLDWNLEAYRPTVTNEAGESVPDPEWTATKKQQAEASRAAMAAFGIKHSSKWSDLLSLNKFINKVKQAVRRGDVALTTAIARGFHNMTPAKQEIVLDGMLAKLKGGEKVGEKEARAAKKGVETNLPSKKELLRLAETRSCPSVVKAFIQFVTGNISSDTIPESLAWLSKARIEIQEQEQAAAVAKAKEEAEKAKRKVEGKVKAKSAVAAPVVVSADPEVMDL